MEAAPPACHAFPPRRRKGPCLISAMIDAHPTTEMPTVRYSVVVPVYNSSSILSQLHSRIAAAMEALRKPFELILVDDASTDGSWNVLEGIARADARVTAMQMASNVGQSLATLAGLRRAAGDTVITLDDDFQHAPEDIPALLAALDGKDGYDAVFGVPFTRRHSPWRRFSSWLVNLVFSPVLIKPFGLRFTAFRAMRRPVVMRLLKVHWPDPFVSSLVFQVAERIGTVPVRHYNSELPASRYSLRKLARIPFGFFGGIQTEAAGKWRPFRQAPDCASWSPPPGALRSPPRNAWVRGLAGTAIYAIAGLVLAFGIAATIVDRRVTAFRRKQLPAIAARRMIVRGQETSDETWSVSS